MYKYDIPESYKSEGDKYSELMFKYPMGISPGTWTSTSSSIAYTYTNDADLFSQLDSALEDYRINATDWNNITNDITALKRTSFQIFMSGWKF
jgi:hypothetical protein